MNNNNNEKLFHAYIFESRDQKLIFDEALKFFKGLTLEKIREIF